MAHNGINDNSSVRIENTFKTRRYLVMEKIKTFQISMRIKEYINREINQRGTILGWALVIGGFVAKEPVFYKLISFREFS